MQKRFPPPLGRYKKKGGKGRVEDWKRRVEIPVISRVSIVFQNGLITLSTRVSPIFHCPVKLHSEGKNVGDVLRVCF